jgi:hypothetical protein
MAEIVVLRPDQPAPPPSDFELALREELPERPVIGIVPNGKPLAKELLGVLADELRKRLGREVEIEMLAKPSAAYPITDDQASAMAARCHIVISGLGD